MIRELLNKWFALPDCKTCEILQRELAETKRERDKLLDKLFEKNESIAPVQVAVEEYKPIQTTRTRFMPAIVRQQIMDEQDQVTLKLMQEKRRELSQPKVEQRIENLENEIGITDGERDASQISKTL